MNKQLFHLPENLTSQARNAFRLMLVLIGVSSAFLVFIGFQIFQTPSWQSWLLASEAVILLILEFRALVLVRRGRHELGILIVLAPIQLMLIITPFLISGLGLVILFSAIMASIIFANQTLPPRQARVLIFIGFVVGIAGFLVDLFIPIQRINLSGFQTFILIGIGILVVTYKKNSQLRDLAESLEKHVGARTEMLTTEVENRKLAEQTILRQNQLLTAAAEIASAITSTLELNKLLVISSELIQEKFGFYHASVFLIEPDSNIAVLRASAGQVNRLPVGEHQLAIGSKSLVGRATATRQPVVVMDVTNDPTHLKNPLLPDTKAEAVIPLLIGELVYGALDVQSTMINAFSDWDVMILDTIADQLAIAVQNARLYASAQQEVVERRRAEQALQFAKAALETQVKVRTAELSQANEQLQVELTERKQAEEALAKEQYLLHALLAAAPDYIYFKDTKGRFIRTSKSHAKAFGLSDPAQVIGKTDFDFFTGEHAGQAYEDEQEIMRTGQPLSKEENETWPDQPDTWVIATKMPLIDQQGKIIGTFGISKDISERKRAEAELEQSVSTLHATLEATADGILVVDRQGKIFNFNRRFTEMWHIPDDIMRSRDNKQVLGFVLDQLADPDAFMTRVDELYSQLDVESFDTLLFKDGRVFERYSRPQLVVGEKVGRVWSFRDITERKQAEEKLVYTALHDPLTNLPNRVLFMDRLQHAMKRAERHKNFMFAVLFLDLDRFKVVNDSLGHNIGDLSADRKRTSSVGLPARGRYGRPPGRR